MLRDSEPLAFIEKLKASYANASTDIAIKDG
jgi:hypothetical protein